MAFELAAFEGPRWATYVGYEIHCCRVDCATTHGHHYKMCFLKNKKRKYFLILKTPKNVLNVLSSVFLFKTFTINVQKDNPARNR